MEKLGDAGQFDSGADMGGADINNDANFGEGLDVPSDMDYGEQYSPYKEE